MRRCELRGRGGPDACANSNSNANTHGHGDANAHANGDAHTDPKPNTNSYCNANSNAHAEPRSVRDDDVVGRPRAKRPSRLALRHGRQSVDLPEPDVVAGD